MIALLVSSVGTLLFGMSSLYGGRLNENDCEMKVYSGIAREINEALLVASRGGNRKLLDALVGFVELGFNFRYCEIFVILRESDEHSIDGSDVLSSMRWTPRCPCQPTLVRRSRIA